VSQEARCPNCGCAFELAPEEIAAIIEAHAPRAPGKPGEKPRFAFVPRTVTGPDGEQQIVIESAPPPPKKNR
jgi:hypothetical protein